MATFSNTDTGDKSSGPYYDKNVDNEVPLKEKIEAVTKFVSSCKFGMMTTRDPSSHKLVSRCMAIAGKVRRLAMNPSYHVIVQGRSTNRKTF